MRLYLAENLKYKHTFTGKLWFLMQALTLLLAYGISRGNGINSAYNCVVYSDAARNGHIIYLSCRRKGQEDEEPSRTFISCSHGKNMGCENSCWHEGA